MPVTFMVAILPPRQMLDVLVDAAFDQGQMLPRPGNRPLEAFGQRDAGLESEDSLGLLGAAEALARAVPLARGAEVERRRVVRQLVDQGGQIENGGFDT